MASRGKIVVLHFVGQMPLAGIAWQAMHYVLGLERLGYEAWYVEDHGANPYDPRVNSVVMDCAYNVAYVRRMMESYGLGDRWAYWDAINDVYHGLSREAVHRLYREADALINLCGAVKLRDEHMACPRRIMIDTDPVYEQIKYAAADPVARAYIDAHTHFFTYGENVGGPGWVVPLCGIPWRGTRPPVVIEEWPTDAESPDCFSTIATWENKGKNIAFGGETYLWSKHMNFLRFLDLPKRLKHCFIMAMLPPTPEVETQVTGAGWRLTDPRPISASMESYAAFIAGSRGEFTVAKDIYVRPNSGWFSDRSVCYLAAGRPVVTMRTGFSRFYPVGDGLFEYSDSEEAAAAIETINGDYRHHSRAARMMAAEYFNSDSVISELMAEVGFS
ncbi:MAG TPA: hypothetical protein VGP50_01585 [Stellaceae bacterium]|nr:hypothetical protein [Stellaceae bacterium]